MQEFVSAMALPFMACLVLTGIHVYLGIHVLARKVIFVDLALAQIAALGAVVGIAIGFESDHDAWVIKGFSLAFTILGAGVFSLTRARTERVPQEAIIGISYAVALAMAVLASIHLPHGADEMRTLFAGSILWIRSDTLVYAGVLYALIGAFHYVFRKRFFQLSFSPEDARQAGVSLRFWDFLFYLSFGFVVTSSVSIAGVLLVFAYLVIPAAIAILLVNHVRARLFVGWIVGAVVSFIGVVVSYQADLPSGPTIVVVLALALLLVGLYYGYRKSQAKKMYCIKLVGAAISMVVLIIGIAQLKPKAHTEIAHMLKSQEANERQLGLKQIASRGLVDQRWGSIARLYKDVSADVRAEWALVVGAAGFEKGLLGLHKLLSDNEDHVRELALRAVRQIQSETSIKALRYAAAREPDDFLQVEMAEALLELGDTKPGINLLLKIMASDAPEQARQDAYEHLSAHTDKPIHYDADAEESTRRRQVKSIRREQ